MPGEREDPRHLPCIGCSRAVASRPQLSYVCNMSKPLPTRKILDWDGRDDSKVLRQIHTLPPGRYAVVPENELVDAESYDERALTPEEIAGINIAIDRKDRGERSVIADDLREDLVAHIRTI